MRKQKSLKSDSINKSIYVSCFILLFINYNVCSIITNHNDKCIDFQYYYVFVC